MLLAISTSGTLTAEPETRRTDGRPDAASEPDREVEDVQDAEQGGEPDRDARLLLRAAAAASAERQARDRRRRHVEETAPDADPAARADRRQARDPGAAGARRQPRGSRAPGPRAQDGRAAAAPGARPADPRPRGPAGETRLVRAAAAGEDRGLPHAEGGDQGAVLGRGGPGQDRRGRDRDRRADGGHGSRDPARAGQDGGDAGARGGGRRAD